MKLRFALIFGLLALAAVGGAGSASAASFDDSVPCPASGALLVCPTFQVGQPVHLQLQGKFGCDEYRWVVQNGSLPAGLTLTDEGLVTGTPTAAGETDPWLQIRDRINTEGGPSWCDRPAPSERQFVFKVSPGLAIQQNSVPGGTIGQPYSQQLTVKSVTSLNPLNGSDTTATWSIQSGSLPAGVTFSSAGLLSGTPTAEGSFTFVVKAAGGGGTTDTETETLVVRQAVTLTSTLGATKAEVGIPLSVTQSAAGGSGTFTWSVSKGALPSGVTLGTDGTVAGTPAVPGRYAFTVTVTDSESRSKSIDVRLVVAKPLALRTVKLKAGKTGLPYRLKLVTVGGVGPMTWRASGKLPKGFKLGKTGLLFGTPTTAGNYRITVTVTDSLGAVAKKTLTLPVKSKRHLKRISK